MSPRWASNEVSTRETGPVARDNRTQGDFPRQPAGQGLPAVAGEDIARASEHVDDVNTSEDAAQAVPQASDASSGGQSSSASEAVGNRLPAQEVERLYRAYGEDLYRFVLGVLKDADEAQEAVQNTFRRCLEVGHTARSETEKGWLFRVAFHEAMALRRRAGADQRKLARFSGDGANQERVSGFAAEAASASGMIQEEQLAQLRAALATLPPDQQWVVEQRIRHEKTFAEIAAELNIPLGTVLTRMRLALKKLRKQMPPSPE